MPVCHSLFNLGGRHHCRNRPNHKVNFTSCDPSGAGISDNPGRYGAREHTLLVSCWYTLRNYFYNDMDPLHPMSFWHLVARLDMDIYPQDQCYGSAV